MLVTKNIVLSHCEKDLTDLIELNKCNESKKTIELIKEKIKIVNEIEKTTFETDVINNTTLLNTEKLLYGKNLELYEIIKALVHKCLETKAAYEEFNSQTRCELTDDKIINKKENETVKDIPIEVKKEIKSYEESFKNYYNALIFSNEYNECVENQINKLLEKEQETNIVLENILDNAVQEDAEKKETLEWLIKKSFNKDELSGIVLSLIYKNALELNPDGMLTKENVSEILNRSDVQGCINNFGGKLHKKKLYRIILTVFIKQSSINL